MDPLASKVAARLQTVWIVRDATPDSTLGDIFWEQPLNRLDDYIRGTPGRAWNSEKHTVYTEEGEAKKDAERRLEKARKKTAMDNLAGNVASKFAGRKDKIIHEVRVSPGVDMQSMPEAKKAIKVIKEKFPGVTLEMAGKSMHGQMPVGQIAPLKKFLSESYPGSTLSDSGPVAKTP